MKEQEIARIIERSASVVMGEVGLPHDMERDDLRQIGWVAALEAEEARKDRGDGQFVGYLKRRVEGAMRDSLKGRQKEAVAVGSLDDENGAAHGAVDPRPNPFEALVAKERREALEVAIEGLAPVYRHLVEKVFLEGMSRGDFCLETGVNANTFDSRRMKALELLRGEMEELR